MLKLYYAMHFSATMTKAMKSIVSDGFIIYLRC